MSVGNDITAAIAGLLTGVAGVQSVAVEPSGDPDVFPAIEIYEGDWQAIDQGLDYCRWQGTWSVTGFVETDTGPAAIAARHDLHADMVAVILADETLGELVESIELGDVRRRTAMLSDKRRLSIEQDFIVEFVTSRTNPGLPA